MDILNLVIIAILIALTAFFVTSEFAIVKVRSSRIDQLIEEGNKKALAAKKVTSNLDEYLSACQLGITITALGLGSIGEPTFEHIFHPLFGIFKYSRIINFYSINRFRFFNHDVSACGCWGTCS